MEQKDENVTSCERILKYVKCVMERSQPITIVVMNIEWKRKTKCEAKQTNVGETKQGKRNETTIKEM